MQFSWQYDEFKPVGRDYGSQTEVDIYDSTHAHFRDLEAESDQVLDTLGLEEGAALIDFGSGTGSFAIRAAARGVKVYAVDVSETMIAKAKAKAEQAGVSGIEFHHAGFLTYEHPEGSADAIATTFAFHHLPDFWKGVALKRMNRMLKAGGHLYIHDVIMEDSQALERIDAFIERQGKVGGDFLREDAAGHFRDEYSTYDWVMDGLLERAGFRIVNKRVDGGVLATYLGLKQ